MHDSDSHASRALQAQRALTIVALIGVAGLLFLIDRTDERLEREAQQTRAELERLHGEIAALRADLLAARSRFPHAAPAADSHAAASAEIDAPPRAAAADTPMAVPPPYDPAPPSAGNDTETSVAREEPPPSETQLGLSRFAALDYAGAIEHFRSVDPSDPEYATARLGEAHAQLYAQNYDEAAAIYRSVLDSDPGSAEAAIGLANAHAKAGRRKEQVAALTRAIEAEPDEWLHYNSRGAAYFFDGDFRQAEADFRKSASLAGDSRTDAAIALENIGVIRLAQEDWSGAFAHARNVNDVDGTRPWNWLVMGIAAVELERSGDAWLAFENWFKYRRLTDPFLIERFLPESLEFYADVTPAGLRELIDPPLANGEPCDNAYQCRSINCAPGAPFNEHNYCVASERNCAVRGGGGHAFGEQVSVEGVDVRCYRAATGAARWTVVEGADSGAAVDGKN